MGPELTFGMGLDMGFQANGGVLASVTVNWDDIDVVVDLVNYYSSSVSGLLPNSVSKTLPLQGEVTVTGEAYATFGLDFGIEYPKMFVLFFAANIYYANEYNWLAS